MAVVDFDSIRVAPPATDLANGMLQFSIIADRPNPAEWPAHFDRDRVLQFFDGYREIIRLSQRKRYGLVDLMIESMIAEAVLPVAATGFFGHHCGPGLPRNDPPQDQVAPPPASRPPRDDDEVTRARAPLEAV